MTCKTCTLARLWFPLCLALWLTAGGADERRNYAALDRPYSGESGKPVEVVEVFWYGCPHCADLGPHLDRLMDKMPDEVAFRRMPAVAPRWEPHARAFYAAESLGQLECFHDALGNAMQVERRRLFSEDDLVDFAAEAGLDADAFRKAYRSPEVQARVEQARALTQRFGIDAVPALIVNGKYRTSLRLAGDHQTMSDTAAQLIRDELEARTAAGTNLRRR